MEKNHLKKYQLIREYPGSPVLGTIAEDAGSIQYTLPDGKSYNESSSRGSEFERLISSQTEYWEEIITEDYKILSFKIVDSNQIVRLIPSGRYLIENFTEKDLPFRTDFGDGWGATLEQALNNLKCGRYNIHSVKRLSDGEIFTIG